MAASAAKLKALQQWCKMQCEGYRDVAIVNMTSSWKSGLAFCAIIHRYRPDLIDYDSLSKENVFENNKLAFDVAESLGIPSLLDPEDMVAMSVPDKLCIITYVAQYYNYFCRCSPAAAVAMKRPLDPGTNTTTIPSFVKRPALVPNMQQLKPIQSTAEPTISRMQDVCAICSKKVYLMERHLENNRLYHRQCIRDQQKASNSSYRRSVDKQASLLKKDMNDDEDDVEHRMVVGNGDSDSTAVRTTIAAVGPAEEKPVPSSEGESERAGGTRSSSKPDKSCDVERRHVPETAGVSAPQPVTNRKNISSVRAGLLLARGAAMSRGDSQGSVDIDPDAGEASSSGKSALEAPAAGVTGSGGEPMQPALEPSKTSASTAEAVASSLSSVNTNEKQAAVTSPPSSKEPTPTAVDTAASSGSTVALAAAALTLVSVARPLSRSNSSSATANRANEQESASAAAAQLPPPSAVSSSSTGPNATTSHSAPASNAVVVRPLDEKSKQTVAGYLQTPAAVPTVTTRSEPASTANTAVSINEATKTAVFSVAVVDRTKGEVTTSPSASPRSSKHDPAGDSAGNVTSSRPLVNGTTPTGSPALRIKSHRPAPPVPVVEGPVATKATADKPPPETQAAGRTARRRHAPPPPEVVTTETPAAVNVPKVEAGNVVDRLAKGTSEDKQTSLDTSHGRPVVHPAGDITAQTRRQSDTVVPEKPARTSTVSDSQQPAAGDVTSPTYRTTTATAAPAAAVSTMIVRPNVTNTSSISPSPVPKPKIVAPAEEENTAHPGNDGDAEKSHARKDLPLPSKVSVQIDPVSKSYYEPQHPVPAARQSFAPKPQQREDEPKTYNSTAGEASSSVAHPAIVTTALGNSSRPVAKPRNLDPTAGDSASTKMENTSAASVPVTASTTPPSVVLRRDSNVAVQVTPVPSSSQDTSTSLPVTSSLTATTPPVILRRDTKVAAVVPTVPSSSEETSSKLSEASTSATTPTVILRRDVSKVVTTPAQEIRANSSDDVAVAQSKSSTMSRKSTPMSPPPRPAPPSTPALRTSAWLSPPVLEKSPVIVTPAAVNQGVPAAAAGSSSGRTDTRASARPVPVPAQRQSLADKSLPTSSPQPSSDKNLSLSSSSSSSEGVVASMPSPPPRAKKAGHQSVRTSVVSPPPPRPQPPQQKDVENSRRRITPDVKFTFEKDAFRSSGLAASAKVPLRPAPVPPVVKRHIVTEEHLPVDVVTQRLVQLDRLLKQLEKKGRLLEEKIRKGSDDAMDDDDSTDVMSEWFDAINRKNELVREETELMYRIKQQELEDQHSEVEYELRRLMAKPENGKTASDKAREAELLQLLVETVSRRNNIVDAMEEDRQRYLEEDKKISEMMNSKGYKTQSSCTTTAKTNKRQ